MVFSNLFFLFLFLPLNLVFYFFAKDIKSKNIVMLVFSLIFYAWGEPIYILLLVGMTFIDWYITNMMFTDDLKTRKKYLSLIIVINLTLLAIFKYGGFILSNTIFLFSNHKSISGLPLPIGLSFYTFQLITYSVDVYRGEVEPQKDFKFLLLYVSMFHQCIAGPIVRYKDINNQLLNRTTNYHEISNGITRFICGLAKKTILANMLEELIIKLIGDNNSSLSNASVVALWVTIISFSLQIYIDFSAYSDMAIGMGQMIGIHYKENFNYPYISKSVTEFWRRWHISLGTFFKDYLYIPLGGNRKGKFRTILNLLIVWSLTGLWHGASWNFVLWGLYFFVFLMLEKLVLLKLLKKNKVASHIYLILVIMFGWILFKFDNINDILMVIKGLFGANSNKFIDFETVTTLKNYCVLLVASIICTTPVTKNIVEKIKYSSMQSNKILVANSVLSVVMPTILLLISVSSLVGNQYNPFLYFRF